MPDVSERDLTIEIDGVRVLDKLDAEIEEAEVEFDAMLDLEKPLESIDELDREFNEAMEFASGAIGRLETYRAAVADLNERIEKEGPWLP